MLGRQHRNPRRDVSTPMKLCQWVCRSVHVRARHIWSECKALSEWVSKLALFLRTLTRTAASIQSWSSNKLSKTSPLIENPCINTIVGFILMFSSVTPTASTYRRVPSDDVTNWLIRGRDGDIGGVRDTGVSGKRLSYKWRANEGSQG